MTRSWLFPALAVGLLAAGAVAILSYLGDDTDTGELIVTQIDGEVLVTGLDGLAAPATAGEALQPRSRVATGVGANAVLMVGDRATIRLGPESTVRYLGRDDQAVSLELEGGALQATVRPGLSALRVGAAGREVLATDASFEMGLADDGALMVDVLGGAVATSGFDDTLQLRAGQRAIASASGVTSLAPVSDALLLEVQWPAERRTRERQTTVRGRTQPSARVRVRGGERIVEVSADEHGDFSVQIALASGVNDLSVEAVDALGHDALVEGYQIDVKDWGPSVGARVEPAGAPP